MSDEPNFPDYVGWWDAYRTAWGDTDNDTEDDADRRHFMRDIEWRDWLVALARYLLELARSDGRRVLLSMLTVVIVNHLMQHSLAQLREQRGELLPAVFAHPAVEILLETLVAVFVWIIAQFGAATVGRVAAFIALFGFFVIWLSFLPNAPQIDPQIGAAYAVFLGIGWGAVFDLHRRRNEYELAHADDFPDVFFGGWDPQPTMDRLRLSLLLFSSYLFSLVSSVIFVVTYLGYFSQLLYALVVIAALVCLGLLAARRLRHRGTAVVAPPD